MEPGPAVTQRVTCSRDSLSVDLDLDEPWVQTVVEKSPRRPSSQKPVVQRTADHNVTNRKVSVPQAPWNRPLQVAVYQA